MIDIKKHIGPALYERDSLIIPNLGGFVSNYEPANIDHVQGLINPPTKKLQFNKNLLINDGAFIAYLQQTLGLGVKEAKNLIEDFVSETREMLDRREIILLPGVGRLYKDYENNLQFLQDNTNYNTASYGLPTLQFYPILRSRPTAIGEMTSDVAYDQPAAGRTFNYRRVANGLIPILLIAIITIGAMIYLRNSTSEVNSQTKVLPIAESRINQKPSSVEQFSLLDGLTNTMSSETTSEKDALPAEDLEEELPVANKRGVIIIGAFGKKAGVERRVKDILAAGYNVYQDKVGKLTRVGIEFTFQHDYEMREKLMAMRDRFDNRAWVLAE